MENLSITVTIRNNTSVSFEGTHPNAGIIQHSGGSLIIENYLHQTTQFNGMHISDDLLENGGRYIIMPLEHINNYFFPVVNPREKVVGRIVSPN